MINTRTAFVAALLVAAGAGIGYGLSNLGGNETTAGTTKAGEKKIAYWVAPMDPNFRRDKPGKSPMGMDLIPVYEGEEPGSAGGGSKALKIDSTIVNNLGVRTARAERSTLTRDISTVGFLAPNDRLTSHVHVFSEGWIEKLAVKTEGERVRKGDVLFQYYSRALVNAQAEFLQALKLNQKLLEEAAENRLRSLGMADKQIGLLRSEQRQKNLVDVLAPQDGYVTALNVREGMFVQPNMMTMSLADLSSVWVMVEIYEDQASWVAEGQKAEMRLQFLPGKTWAGRVDYVYPTVDPKSRTVRVRLVFDNPDGALKPNMYADVVVHGAPHQNVVSIPREALIRAGNMERVILSIGEGRFRPAQVVSGIESGGRVEIVRGLKEGETVVTSGQFLIDSEASLDATLLRLAGPEGSPGTAAGDLISGIGIVNEIKIAERKINLTHEAIEPIGWPKMTMDFRVADDVDLKGVKTGKQVSFRIRKDDAAGDYVVHSIGGNASVAGSATGIKATGVINSIVPSGRKVNLTHQPIDEIGWPSMTMDFRVGSGVDLNKHKAGEKVSVVLRKDEKAEDYVIVSIEGGKAGNDDRSGK